MSSISTSNLTSGFIDLATFDETEKYLYGGPDALAYFVRETRKSTWFTQVPVVLSRGAGTPAFGQQWSTTISRAGDYMLYSWIRLVLPSVAINPAGQYGANGRIRWTRNLMHNLIQEAAITFNDLVAARFDNFQLDFWAAFTVPASKQVGYNNMIGTINSLVQPSTLLPSAILNLPLPFFYSRDSGVALPTAALPYNDMRLQFVFRDWTNLMIVDNVAAAAGTNPSRPPTSADVLVEPVLQNVQVWANYAIVSNDERKRMACSPRDILMEQVQTLAQQNFAPATNPTPSYDIRFSHAIKAIFFAVRNKTVLSEYSNYTCASPQIVTSGGSDFIDFTPSGATDPINLTSLIYENTQRLFQMGSDYYSLVNPYYAAPNIPTSTGYHLYSYSLDFYNIDPQGSTNYGKLTNVSIVPEASAVAIAAANGVGPPFSGTDYVQTYTFVTTALNNNIIRISGGSLGFPVL